MVSSSQTETTMDLKEIGKSFAIKNNYQLVAQDMHPSLFYYYIQGFKILNLCWVTSVR